MRVGKVLWPQGTDALLMAEAWRVNQIMVRGHGQRRHFLGRDLRLRALFPQQNRKGRERQQDILPGNCYYLLAAGCEVSWPALRTTAFRLPRSWGQARTDCGKHSAKRQAKDAARRT